MTDIKRLHAFQRRWNIQWDDATELNKFRNRIIANTSATFARYQPDLWQVDKRFSFLVGEPSRESALAMLNSFPYDDEFTTTQIYESVVKAENLTQIAGAIQSLLWAIENASPRVLDDLLMALREAIEYSPTINLRIAKRGDKATIYRAGAKTLDELVVNDVLEWLQSYPKVAKHFEEALRIYLVRDKSKYRNLLDNLRFAVEQLLRSVLRNRKSLENQMELILQWLNQKGVHQQIINMYRTLLKQFTQYQNDAVKHGEAFSSSEIEFMIYLTGTFMRLVLELETEQQQP